MNHILSRSQARAFLFRLPVVLFLLVMVAKMGTNAASASSFSTYQDAALVIGQQNFISNNSATTQTTTPVALDVAVSSKNVLAVASSSRVLLFYNVPSSNGAPAHVVVGKADFTTVLAGSPNATTGTCNGVAFSPDGTKLLVADSSNNRVLIWNTIPTNNGQAADVVVGQGDFTGNSSATSARGLNYPTDVLVTPSGKVVIADQINSRVLIYNTIPTQNYAPADVVIGQSDFNSSGQGTAVNQLKSPCQIALTSGGRLLVSDEGTHSVRVWNSIPTANGTPASVIIGQGDFSTSDSGTSASRLFSPKGLSVSPTGQLAIGEYNNNRVLIYNSVPTTNGASADMVLGQPDFLSRQANSGGLSAKSMFQVAGVAFAPDGRLFVAAPGNNRVLVFGVANAFPTISTTTLPEAHLAQSYSAQLVGADANGDPLTWSLASGTLPAGLTLSNGGLLSGTPTANGVSTFTVQVNDGQGGTATRSFGIAVSEANSLVVTTLSDSSTNMDNVTSLREAITFANSLGLSSPQTVSFAVSGTIELTGTLPSLGILTVSNTQAGGITLNGGGTRRIFDVANTGSKVTLEGLTLTGGKSTAGGAISISAGNVTINRCTFIGNAATGTVGGGAILQNGIGTLTVTGSTFSDNSTVTGDGGAINSNGFGKVILTECVLSGNSADDGGTPGNGGNGGALCNNNGTVTITNCTFSGNRSMNGALYNLAQMSVTGSTFAGNQAAYNGGGIVNQVTMSLTNCTITGNSATSYGGGGINNIGLGKLTVVNCTIAGNSSTGAIGGGGIYNTVTLNLKNSIVTGNTATTGANIGGSAAITDQGFNLIDGDAKLASLANNGGPTQTLALLPGSLAINRGSSGVLTDQRGVARDQKPDIGAYEALNTAPTVSGITLYPTSPKTQDTLTATPTATDAENDALTYSYAWSKNGTPIVGETGATLDLAKPSNGDKGDQITVTVTASDGIATSSFTADAVTIKNSAPLVANVTVAPGAYRTNDTLSLAVGTLTDADGDTLSRSYQWKKNGQDLEGETGTTLDLSRAGNGDKGDQLSVVVTATDGSESTASESPLVTVSNTDFSFSGLSITPSSPRRRDILRAEPVTSDADGDVISFVYRWKKNGNLLPGQFEATLNLGTTGIALKGDRFSSIVSASEAGGSPVQLESNEVTIQNTIPEIASVALPPRSQTEDVLSAQVQASDIDHDTLTATYQWKKNGEVLVGQTGATLNLGGPGNGDRGDSISVVVTESDGSASVTRESNTTLIDNSAPVISQVSIDNPSPTSKKTLTATASATDADGDQVTLTYAWKKNDVLLEGETASTLDLSKEGNGDVGDTITAVVTATDNHDGTATKESQAVRIRWSEAPSDLTLSPTSIPENEAAGTLVGTFSTVGPDSGPLFTYTLDEGEGDTDNALFQIQGDKLYTKAAFDFESKNSYSILVSSRDDNGQGVQAILSIGVTDVNEAPAVQVSLSPTSPSTDELLEATATASDPEKDKVALTYLWKKNGAVIEGETSAALDLSKAGNGDRGDKISVFVTATDGRGATASQESEPVSIAGSAPLSLALSSTSVAENQPAGTEIGTFSTSDADGGTSYTYSLVAGEGDSDNSAFSISGNRLLSKQKFDFETKNLYRIRVSSKDEDGKVVESSFTITITNVNEAPSAKVTLAPTSPTTNASLQATVTGLDAEGNSLSYSYQWKRGETLLSGETGATLNLAKAGNGEKGERITVTVVPSDGALTGAAASASVLVANSAPTLTATTFQGRENQKLSAQLGGQDADKEALAYSLVSNVRYGTLSLGSNGSFTYTPRLNWNGTDSFQARVRDGSGATATATITLIIAPLNGIPVAVSDVVKGVEDVPLSIAAATLLRNDSNGESSGEVDALQIVRVAVPAGFPGTLRLDVAKQTLLFTPKANWNGTTTFTYTIQDSGRALATAQVTLQIAAVNDAPVALAGRLSVLSGTLGELALSGSDVEGDALTFALATKPANGTAQVVKVGDKWVVRYQSKVGFTGTDTLSVVARDGKLNSLPATITITVTPNSAPTLVSLTPNKGTFPVGSTVVFEQKVRDLNGTAHLDATALLIGNLPAAANARGGATLWFDAVLNQFTLTKDDGVSTLAPVALGGTLENSQVKVTLGAGDVARDRYGVLTLRWRVTFKPSFVGTKSLWMRVEDLGGLSAGFTKSGDITLASPAKEAPSNPSAPVS